MLKYSSFAFFLFFICLEPAASASFSEANALMKWKASFVNQNNSILKSWNLETKNSTNFSGHPKASSDPCNWFGVSCIDGSVNRLNLTNASIHAFVSELLFSSFPNLAYLDLSVNSLFGTIPPQIGKLSKLVYLDLATNQFTGAIPSEIGQLTNLQFIRLAENQLAGLIPQEIGQLVSLSYLSLRTNKLDGSIPVCFGKLRNMTDLYLDENQLSSSIPSELGKLKALQILSLSTNNLTGQIPASSSGLTSLSDVIRDRQSLGRALKSKGLKLTSQGTSLVKGSRFESKGISMLEAVEDGRKMCVYATA